MNLLACDGNVTITRFGLPRCDTAWYTVTPQQIIDATTSPGGVDPSMFASAWSAGFLLAGLFFVGALGVQHLLRFIRSI